MCTKSALIVLLLLLVSSFQGVGQVDVSEVQKRLDQITDDVVLVDSLNFYANKFNRLDPKENEA